METPAGLEPANMRFAGAALGHSGKESWLQPGESHPYRAGL